MAARWIALALAVFTFAIVGFFVMVALRPFPGPNASADGEIWPVQTTHRIGPLIVTAQIAVRSGAAEIMLSIRDDRGRPATPEGRPTVLLKMTDMEMAAQPVSLRQTTADTWRGIGHPSMAGRWNFIVILGGEEIEVPFNV